jgi:hypothetical protein
MEEEKTSEQIIHEIKIDFLMLLQTSSQTYIISLLKAFEWLDEEDKAIRYATDSVFRANFNTKVLKSDNLMLARAETVDDIGADYVMKNYKTDKSTIKLPWFSPEGFKTFCMVSGARKSHYVRRYFIEVERDYWRSLRQTTEENKKELASLTAEIQKIEHSNEKLIDENDTLLNKLCNIENQYNKYKDVAEIVIDYDAFATSGTPEHKAFLLAKKKYFFKSPIYVVSPDYMKKRKPSKNYDSIDYNIEDYDIEDVDYDTIRTDSLSYYYIYLPNSALKTEREGFRKLGVFEIISKQHMEKLREILVKKHETSVKNIFAVSFYILECLANDLISEELYTR